VFRQGKGSIIFWLNSSDEIKQFLITTRGQPLKIKKTEKEKIYKLKPLGSLYLKLRRTENLTVCTDFETINRCKPHFC
jgi:hypothetical protein